MTGTLLTRSVNASDGLALHLEGDGEPTVLMLHGLGYASWEAQPVRAELGAEFGLWSLDNRGTGRSDSFDGECSIDQLAEDAAVAIRQLGGPLVVVGHSMGGYIAQALAAKHPDLVRGLVLIATSPGGPDSQAVPTETRRAWTEASGLAPTDYARHTMPLSFRPGWTDEHPEAFERLLGMRLAHPTTQDVWRAQFTAAEDFLANGTTLGRTGIPTLVIHGMQDRVVPVANGGLLSRQLPTSEYHEVPGAGHLVHLEQPALVANLITTFTANNLHHESHKKHQKKGRLHAEH